MPKKILIHKGYRAKSQAFSNTEVPIVEIVTDRLGRKRFRVVRKPVAKCTPEAKAKMRDELITNIEGRQAYLERKAKEITHEYMARAKASV